MKGSREFKGNSLLEDVSDYVAIDLETIGLDPMYDDIIESVSYTHLDAADE
mgnify:CR=1 FL=1